MKKSISAVLILAVMSLGIPGASAEISQDLDPMVSPEPQATVTAESSVNNSAAGQADHATSVADAAKTEKKSKKVEKEKSKKNSKKKSSSPQSSKSAKKHSKKNKANAQ